MKRALAITLMAAVSLAPACRMQEVKPNLNKAPIVETIRDAGVRMADSNKEKLNALVPAKAQPEQKAAEPDAGVTQGKPHATVKPGKEENAFKIDWSKLEIKATPRGPEPSADEKEVFKALRPEDVKLVEPLRGKTPKKSSLPTQVQ